MLHSKYLPCLLLLLRKGRKDQEQTKKDKMTPKSRLLRPFGVQMETETQGEEGTCPGSHTEGASGRICPPCVCSFSLHLLATDPFQPRIRLHLFSDHVTPFLKSFPDFSLFLQ